VTQKFELVTGAAGFIGSHLTKRLLEQERNVIAIDCFLPDLYSSEIKKDRWKSLSSPSNCELVKLDFDMRTDDFSKLANYDIRSIFNEAAMPGLSSDWGKFAPYYECNLSALNRLLEFSRSLPSLNMFVQASTSSVYGKNAVGNERGELRPSSPYGVSKLAAEKLLIAYSEAYAIPTTILRYFSVYGPNQRPDMAYSRIIDAILHGKEFLVFGSGEQKRSNTYIDDVVNATILAEARANPGKVINICGDETISLNQAVSLIEELLGKKLRRRQEEPRNGDQQTTSGDNQLAKEILGWRAKVKINEGLARQVSEAKFLFESRRGSIPYA